MAWPEAQACHCLLRTSHWFAIALDIVNKIPYSHPKILHRMFKIHFHIGNLTNRPMAPAYSAEGVGMVQAYQYDDVPQSSVATVVLYRRGEMNICFCKYKGFSLGFVYFDKPYWSYMLFVLQLYETWGTTCSTNKDNQTTCYIERIRCTRCDYQIR